MSLQSSPWVSLVTALGACAALSQARLCSAGALVPCLSRGNGFQSIETRMYILKSHRQLTWCVLQAGHSTRWGCRHNQE